MTCSDHQQNISRLLDNELAEDSQKQIFAHLASCAACREFFSTSRFVRRHLEDMPEFPGTTDTPVLEAARAHASRAIPSHRGARKSLLRRRLMIPLPTAAAVLLVLAASIVFSINAYEASATAEEQVIYVPTLPEIKVEATLAATEQSEEIMP